jgi:hypothetical protein
MFACKICDIIVVDFNVSAGFLTVPSSYGGYCDTHPDASHWQKRTQS